MTVKKLKTKIMKNKIVLWLTGLWAALVAINEAGLFEIIPIDNEKIVGWIKFGISAGVIFLNAKYYNKTVNPDPKPPKD